MSDFTTIIKLLYCFGFESVRQGPEPVTPLQGGEGRDTDCRGVGEFDDKANDNSEALVASIRAVCKN